MIAMDPRPWPIKFPAVAYDALAHRLDIRAVIADEHHEQSIRTAAGRNIVALAVGAGEIEARCCRTETCDGYLRLTTR